MDKRTLLAIVLSFGIFYGWQKLYIEPRLPQGQAPSAQQTTPPAQATSVGAPSGAAQAPAASAPTGKDTAVIMQGERRPPQTATLTSKTGVATLGDGSHFVTGWNLKSYRLNIAPEAAAVDLKSVVHQPGELQLAFDDPAFAYLNDVQGTLEQTPTGAVWRYEDANIKLSREFKATETQPWVDLAINMEFKAKRPNFAFISIQSQGIADDHEAQDRQLLYFQKDALERFHVKDAAELKEGAGPVKYIAATSRYFVFAVISEAAIPAKALLQPVAGTTSRLNLVYPLPGNSLSLPLRVYFGPKELGILRETEPKLDLTVDFGWFTVVAYPLLNFLRWLYSFTHNYGIAIILLTIALKIATFPLTYKSMKSMKEMAKIQPQLARLRERYKDDKESLNREMLTLMRTNGYNPMAGCWPILIQMPVFFALYRVLYESIELYQAPFGLWIHDLSSKDPYYVTPVLLTLTMYLQQKLQPNTATDPAQQKMLQFMPIMFGAFMIALPSGLTIYMLVNAVVSIIQQLFLNKKLGMGPQARVATAT